MIFLREDSIARVFAAVLMACLPAGGRATPVTVASESFNSLGTAADATLPAPWKTDAASTLSAETARRPGDPANATNATTKSFTGTTMGTTTGGIYNFGSNAADRAVGWLATGTGYRNCNLYFSYAHQGPDSIGYFRVSYGGRKFRHGSNEAGFALRLFYATNDVAWTEVPAGTLAWEGGSAPPDQEVLVKLVTNVLVNQPLEPGETICFAWNYCVASGTTTTSAQGLGVDDVVITAHPPLANPPTVHVSAPSLSGFYTLVGTPSAALGFTLTGSNLTDAVTLTAPQGFELSWDGSVFTPILTNHNAGVIVATNVHVRLAAATVPAAVAGNLLVAGGGLLLPVQVALSGMVDRDRSHLVFCEDFEKGSKTSYAVGEVEATEGRWLFDNAMIGDDASDQRHGCASARVRGSGGTLTMLFDKTNGVGEVSLFHGLYGSDSGVGVAWTLAVSRDGGASWDAFVSDAQTTSAAWREAVFTNVNVAGAVRLKLTVSGGSDHKRVNIDDLAMSDYVAPALAAAPIELEPFSARLGAPSVPQCFVVSGNNLTNLVSVTAPGGYAVALQSDAGFEGALTLAPADGAVPETNVYVRLTGAAAGTFDGQVVVSSTGAASVTVAVTGAVLANLPPAIAGLPATTNVLAGQPLYLAMLATDSDGAVAQLEAVSGTIAGAAGLLDTQPDANGLEGLWSWTPPLAGLFGVEFIATDNEGGCATQGVAIAVAPQWWIPVIPGRRHGEDFDSMEDGFLAAARLPAGWKAGLSDAADAVGCFADATTATDLCGGNNLPSTAGIYNFGAGDPATAPDRSVGFLCKGEDIKSGSLMARLVNVSRDIIPAIDVAFDVEKYRMGTNPAGFAVELLTSPDGAQWTPACEPLRVVFTADDITAGYDAAPGAVVHCAGRLGPLRFLPGTSLFLAWHYRVATGTVTTYAQALGLDNIEIRPHGPPQTLLILR